MPCRWELQECELLRRVVGRAAIILRATPWETSKNCFEQVYLVTRDINGARYTSYPYFNYSDARNAFEERCRQTAIALAKEVIDG
jgi:hypothetical protein